MNADDHDLEREWALFTHFIDPHGYAAIRIPGALLDDWVRQATDASESLYRRDGDSWRSPE
ncbi:hypothetical protein ABZU76_23675 [Amycolatopsis sp. NPDC005232]|uniref:hypothetical protein n=1 Tax=Amycolatopsis sp. NPDC005232 TaxID=3157027 RepID=UPI0033A4784E